MMGFATTRVYYHLDALDVQKGNILYTRIPIVHTATKFDSSSSYSSLYIAISWLQSIYGYIIVFNFVLFAMPTALYT